MTRRAGSQGAPRHDRDAGGPADVLAAKAALREQVWSAMRAARVARLPGAAGRIPNFAGAEAAAGLLAGTPQWRAARTLRANPDSAQLPVRQRALADGKTVYMAVPRLAGPAPFFALDPDMRRQAGHRRRARRPGAARRQAGRVTPPARRPDVTRARRRIVRVPATDRGTRGRGRSVLPVRRGP
ncbi:MAG TPA: hypothetical protein VKV35_08540 [Streptosporangiaceae bacterium]|nr:hypothetical protein [Streptosporangiaceae bacterium]